jgi:hypothetical protein
MVSTIQRSDEWMTGDVAVLTESVQRLDPITSQVTLRMKSREDREERVQQQLVLLMTQKSHAMDAVQAARQALLNRTEEGETKLKFIQNKIDQSRRDENALLKLGKWFENDPMEEAKLISSFKPNFRNKSQDSNDTLAELQLLVHETSIEFEKQHTQEAQALSADKKYLLANLEAAEADLRVIGAKFDALMERNRANKGLDRVDEQLLEKTQAITSTAKTEIEYTKQYWTHRKIRLANIASRMHSLSNLFHQLHDLVVAQ